MMGLRYEIVKYQLFILNSISNEAPDLLIRNGEGGGISICNNNKIKESIQRQLQNLIE